MKNVLKIFGISILAVLFLSVAVLAAHLILVTQDKKTVELNYQLSRIDLQTPLDSTHAYEARAVIQSIPGVNHAYVNIQDGILIYSYDPEIQKFDVVFETLLSNSNLSATAYIPSEINIAKGCPTGSNDDSLPAKMMRAFR